MASVPCACRDCFDIATGDTTTSAALCLECEEAGCTNHRNLPDFMTAYGLGYECQRDDAYEGMSA